MYIVGITGGSGSGKTTFTEKLISRLPKSQISVLHMDSYYKSLGRSIEEKKNFDHPDAFDWELLLAHLEMLKNGMPIRVPVYDFKTSSRTEKFETLEPKKIVIFEGIFALYSDEIKKLLNLKIFLQVDSDIRLMRRLLRDIKERGRSLDSITKQYYNTVRPMYEKYISPQKQFADVIVGEETDIAADTLSSHLLSIINKEANLKDMTKPLYDHV